MTTKSPSAPPELTSSAKKDPRQLQNEIMKGNDKNRDKKMKGEENLIIKEAKDQFKNLKSAQNIVSMIQGSQITTKMLEQLNQRQSVIN